VKWLNKWPFKNYKKMAFILHIDTTTDHASIGISLNGIIAMHLDNPVQKEHGSFLHLGIQQLCAKMNIQMQELDAISVLIGPGSYTGIRIGLATAKGLSYALKKPLIAIDTLTALAYTAKKQAANLWYCPMIDARRMEVFYALYNEQLETVVAPTSLLLTPDSFAHHLQERSILFVGNGASKWATIATHQHAVFASTTHNISGISALSYAHFMQHNFADIRSLEACYAKAFYDTRK
jgi:tRNA threonylcarbamoyladenosine biosynthesis protein TsaB